MLKSLLRILNSQAHSENCTSKMSLSPQKSTGVNIRDSKVLLPSWVASVTDLLNSIFDCASSTKGRARAFPMNPHIFHSLLRVHDSAAAGSATTLTQIVTCIVSATPWYECVCRKLVEFPGLNYYSPLEPKTPRPQYIRFYFRLCSH